MVTKKPQPVVVTGHGRRIEQAIFDRQSALGRRYTQSEFGRDVGMRLRGKPLGRSTLVDWIAERNQPSLEAFAAMEAVLERPGIRVYLAFGVWPQEKAPAHPPTVIEDEGGVPVRQPGSSRAASQSAVNQRGKGRRVR